MSKPLVDKLQRGGATVAVMLEPFFDKNHKIVTDNLFNSPTLSRMLLENGTFMIGTVQKRRKGMPKMAGKLPKGHVVTHTIARNPANSRTKPDSVLMYNKTMGAVDLMDKTIKPFSNHRKTYKWYKKVFFYLVDVAICNSYRAYHVHHAADNKYSAYKDFVLNVIESIMDENPNVTKRRGRGSTVPAPQEVAYHIPVRDGRSNCVWCWNTKNQKRSQVPYKCSVCNVRLCIQKGLQSCYSAYHQDLQNVICIYNIFNIIYIILYLHV